MKSLPTGLRHWSHDTTFRRIVKNSGYLFSSNTISAALSMVQSVFAARLLGIDGFGILGSITSFSSTINRLFSFRMGELVVTYAGAYAAENKPRHAAALIKAALLAEALISVVAFFIILLLSPLAARFIADDISMTPLFQLYAFAILGNLVTETSTGVLQIGNHYRGQAAINLAQSLLTAGLIVLAFILQADMTLVVVAYLVGKIILGTSPAILALRRMPEMFGKDWWSAPFSLLPPWRELRQFALSTNFAATVNLVARDSEQLWIGLFVNPTAMGYYKVALAITNFVQMPIQPLINTTFPEIRRTIAEKQWPQLRETLRKMSLIAAAWTGAVSIGLLVFGSWVISLLYKPESAPAYPAVLVLLLGYGFANVFFWNRNLVLSLGDPVYPFRVTLWVGLAKVALMFIVVPVFGYVSEALLLSLYFIVSISLIVRRGLRYLREAEQISYVRE